jgi:putative nucleotidyltransferase with HDIG domain
MITGNVHLTGDYKKNYRKSKPSLSDGMVECGDPALKWIEIEGSSSLLYEIAVKAVELLDITHCQILVLGSNGVFHCQAYHWNNSAYAQRSTGRRDYQRAQEFLQKIILSDGPVYISPNDRLLSNEQRSALKSHSLENLLLFPMRLDTEPVGVFVVGFEKIAAIDEKVRLASLFSRQAALALHREGLPYSEDESVIEIVMALSKALEARDLSTGAHCRKITRLTEKIALHLGCPFHDIQAIRRAALLHDIGKIGIPDQILYKPGPLSEREWVVMRQHPEIGARILRTIHGLSDVARLVLAHHERYDGSGYPYGLSGENIPMGARILAVVDAYGAMVVDRVYRSARSFREAVDELKRCAGKDFDPIVVEAFLGLLENHTDLDG